jgi:transcription-repair coupling factor (superfamily II helicase)
MPDTIKPADARLDGVTLVAGAPEGADAMFLGAVAANGRTVVHVCRDDARLYRLAELLRFFHPGVGVLSFPAWDCLPYDRASPQADIMAARAGVLARLARLRAKGGGRIVLTTVSAALQRVPPPAVFEDAILIAEKGRRLSTESLMAYLAGQGYRRAGTVREPGEYAVRGGIVDLFPPAGDYAVRLDFFGDEIESIRRFDPVTQRSLKSVRRTALLPVSEIVLDDARITHFRERYRAVFPAAVQGDPLYEAVSAGQRFPGYEHWLPFFFERMATVFDYAPPSAAVSLDHQAQDAASARLDQIADYYDARQAFLETAAKAAKKDEFVYRPVPPEAAFVIPEEWQTLLAERAAVSFSPFAAPSAAAGILDLGGRPAPGYAEARADPKVNVLDRVVADLDQARAAGNTVLVTAHSPGSRARIEQLLGDHGLKSERAVETWDEVGADGSIPVCLAVLPIDRGFRSGAVMVVTEEDIFGERLVRRPRRQQRGQDFLTEFSSLQQGDFVVHLDHGVGRYEGLETVTVGGGAHDCLRLIYDGGDVLFLPVENMELLSRYGSEESSAQLDKLGGVAWQARKARVRKRVKDMADKLIAIAAQRALHQAEVLHPPAGAFEEFEARFPFDETDDQRHAIGDVVADLESGRPMDRLVCGDVGFGKTEVALRAAFIASMSGVQVAIAVPTTLLARQHYQTFAERFRGFPLRVAQLSRLTGANEAKAVKAGLADGSINVVVGTHTLLGKSVTFDNLGLVVVDEEQHFGVAQKERLKELRANVHVLTLTATPIPRTLQLALTGVRDMSLIATPPVDRLAVRTFVLPYDPVVVREALQRELFRGGQVFYVCPRIEDLGAVAGRVRELVPEATLAIAHGQMAAAELEDVMSRFYSGEVRILVATNIIESGLDIPTVNTIVIHRADRFGLAQLYQLRGRVGRSKTRAYAYLTLPADRPIGETALRRLEVMQTLDTLGAGFTLASHDLDIRGAGNLLGEEQSGHIREVGIELYQQMLEEAVATARTGGEAGAAAAQAGEESWSPQISVGTAVLIPEDYVADLSARMGLYRRLARLIDTAEIDAFAAELVDRFGAMPEEVSNLLEIIAIKRLCVQARIDKVDAGPKGAVVTFHGESVPNAEGLVRFVAQQAGTVSLRPDYRLIYRRDWKNAEARVRGVKYLAGQLAAIAGAAAPQASASASAASDSRAIASKA